MNTTTPDLNLLRVLVTIGETLNLSRASEQLRLSQPALSYSLKKLRVDFQDPLFVRSSHGFQPTPRALSLIPEAKKLLESSLLLYSPDSFELKNYKRTVTLAMTTYFEALAIVPLMKRLKAEAPGINLKTISLQGEFPKRQLESGETDLAIAAYFQDVPENYFIQTLGRDRHVAVVRKNHPYLKSQQTLADYLSYSHLKIGVPLDTISTVDEILKEKKLSRHLSGNFNNFLSPLIAVSETDSILTIPEKLAVTFKRLSDVEIVEVPLKASYVELKMIWHSRYNTDPFHKWLRQVLREIYK